MPFAVRFALPRLLGLAAVTLLLAACGGGDAGGSATGGTNLSGGSTPTTYTVANGTAQKGPLVQGSTVTAQELDSTLSPTGRQYGYQVTSDLGKFTPSSSFTSAFVGVSATGLYFDESLGRASTSSVTLNGYADVSSDTVLNINLLTTLAYQRIRTLVSGSGLGFAAARTQAEREVLIALRIPLGSYARFGSMDLAGSADGDRLLAAVSSLFAQASQAAALSQLIGNIQSDIAADGRLDDAATRAVLAAAAQSLNPNAIAANLNQRYAGAGANFVAGDIAAWIDGDGDGLIGRYIFSVPSATPSTAFNVPPSLVTGMAGSAVSVSAGKLAVNGTAATGPVTVKAGDVLTISPGTGLFPDNGYNVELSSNGTKVARVTFTSSLLSIAVTPSSSSVAKGVSRQYTATGTYSDERVVDLTARANWMPSAASVASVSATGLASTLATGATTISATMGSVTGSALLNVTPATLNSMRITPRTAHIDVGTTWPLALTGTYSDGSAVTISSSATWSSAAPSVVAVGNSTGVASGVSLGSTLVTATIGSLQDSVPVEVVPHRWTSVAPLAAARSGHKAILLANGKVLVIGGSGSSGILASCELYDPASGSWSAAGSMATSRNEHTATLLANGKVLVTGGYNDVPRLATAELYDPTTNSWSSVAALTGARNGHSATLLANGKVLVAGGYNGGALGTVQLFDPGTGTWSSAPAMIQARWNHAATVLADGKVLVSGGQFDGSMTADNAEIYDPQTSAWSSAGRTQKSRSVHTATLLPGGKVMVTGVFMPLPNTRLEVFNPVDRLWSIGALPIIDRYAGTATLLPNGTVLLAGGLRPPPADFPTISELYDPISDSVSPAGNLATGRAMASTTLLPDGRVLIAGGYNSSGVLSSSELFTP